MSDAGQLLTGGSPPLSPCADKKEGEEPKAKKEKKEKRKCSVGGRMICIGGS